MFIPAMETVGGFSITSTPKKLPYFDLAVQKTNHPPTLWLAEECKVGDVVSIRSGGTFYWDKSFDKKKVMLVAGGIGINPLFSILSEVKNMLEENDHSPLEPPKFLCCIPLNLHNQLYLIQISLILRIGIQNAFM